MIIFKPQNRFPITNTDVFWIGRKSRSFFFPSCRLLSRSSRAGQTRTKRRTKFQRLFLDCLSPLGERVDKEGVDEERIATWPTIRRSRAITRIWYIHVSRSLCVWVFVCMNLGKKECRDNFSLGAWEWWRRERKVRKRALERVNKSKHSLRLLFLFKLKLLERAFEKKIVGDGVAPIKIQ